MASYSINDNGNIEIDFNGVIPSFELRGKMKAVKYCWNPRKMVWWAHKSDITISIAKEICGEDQAATAADEQTTSSVTKKAKDYALKLKIREIINADETQLKAWERILKDHVNEIMSEDNSKHSGNSVSKSQESVWMDCFKFIKLHLKGINALEQEYELVFEYSLPGTVHKRPDVLLLTERKSISLEFKRKEAPQIDSNKDDVAQAIRYKEWLQNHHKVTKEREMIVKSYLVCTHEKAVVGTLSGINILTGHNFCAAISAELSGEVPCCFIDEWLASAKTEMPDMLHAMEIMYRDGKIPYISDVNNNCLSKVLSYISDAKQQNKKILILINGVPGAGKTAVGQSIVFEENKKCKANAVYLSGNGPLVEVIQYQINKVGKNKNMAENAIQGMKDFKTAYFFNNTKLPEQSILVFDEAQRAWDENKLGKGFSEPEGLFRVGERIYEEKGYAVLVGLYGNGQVIYTGEEAGPSLWEEALKKHDDWVVVSASGISKQLQGFDERKIIDDDMFLSMSLRADFIDCSKWVEQAIGRNNATEALAKKELETLQNTSLRICMTRDFNKIKERATAIDEDHPEWKYGILLSNFAEQNVIRKALPGWVINGTRNRPAANMVQNGQYGSWFVEDCKKLDRACSVYGNQGLELDCPIVVFGGEYIRKNGQWVARGDRYNFDVSKNNYQDTDSIVENNFRVLLTRARKEMIILIPDDRMLDETYQYFVDMGMDEL